MDIDSVLNQMRREHAPTQEDRDRVRAALTTALVVSGTAGAAHVATTAGVKGAAAANGMAAVKGTALALPVWIKGTIGIGTLAAAIGGGVYGVNAYEAARAPREAAMVQHADVTAANPPVAPVEALPAGVQPAASFERSVALSPSVEPMVEQTQTTVPVAHHKSKLGSAKAPPTANSSTATSLAELRLIGEASRAIREGRTDEARSTLAEHEKRYSNTALGQERAGLDLLARCAEGNSEQTRRAAEALLRSSPKSPLAGTIRRECLT
jgi:hypothetical protein